MNCILKITSPGNCITVRAGPKGYIVDHNGKQTIYHVLMYALNKAHEINDNPKQ